MKIALSSQPSALSSSATALRSTRAPWLRPVGGSAVRHGVFFFPIPAAGQGREPEAPQQSEGRARRRHGRAGSRRACDPLRHGNLLSYLRKNYDVHLFAFDRSSNTTTSFSLSSSSVRNFATHRLHYANTFVRQSVPLPGLLRGSRFAHLKGELRSPPNQLIKSTRDVRYSVSKLFQLRVD